MGKKKEEINIVCGARVAELLKDYGDTQKGLAVKLNYVPQHISRIIQGKSRLTETVARRIAKLYGSGPDCVRYEWLMGYDDFKTVEDVALQSFEKMGHRNAIVFEMARMQGYTIEKAKVSYPTVDGDRVVQLTTGGTATEAFSHWIGKDYKPGTRFEDVAGEIVTCDGYEITAPNGNKFYITESDFNFVISDIYNYVGFRLHAIQGQVT